ncbi:DNA starvation/stationary phase protection protein [Pseudonocardia halophobica]|uniref:DNA starvation/stationary phase protection protein n=1 Tax=Pseudonocardia halophobica TaxID=29401 RepID=A0A9W6UFV9_9PSEU|nr:DNA starvation/stationary phase protection protein [Pseudonocardia halophobica]GLL15788.1 DNA starvation/stationary phase protection protein [Pseudonocardia halophobica]
MTATNTTTSAPTAFRPFTASPELEANLQKVLVDLVALHLEGKQFHWNVVGSNFRDLHLQLDEIVEVAREHSDTIAERMRALYAVPDGSPRTVAETTSLPRQLTGEQDTTAAVNAMSELLHRTAATARQVHDAVDAEDPSTADLLHAVIVDLEKQAWMLSSENRRA